LFLWCFQLVMDISSFSFLCFCTMYIRIICIRASLCRTICRCSDNILTSLCRLSARVLTICLQFIVGWYLVFICFCLDIILQFLVACNFNRSNMIVMQASHQVTHPRCSSWDCSEDFSYPTANNIDDHVKVWRIHFFIGSWEESRREILHFHTC